MYIYKYIYTLRLNVYILYIKLIIVIFIPLYPIILVNHSSRTPIQAPKPKFIQVLAASISILLRNHATLLGG